MKFKFKIQQYQTEAVEQTVNVFAGQPSKTNAQYRRDLGKRSHIGGMNTVMRHLFDFDID
ncbi:MAG: hypothetical protein IJJ56_07220 [Prevotella sp.]|nr:hypothetical protein [Prevotella sp.]